MDYEQRPIFSEVASVNTQRAWRISVSRLALEPQARYGSASVRCKKSRNGIAPAQSAILLRAANPQQPLARPVATPLP
jgi:hypothetical protein